PAASTTSQPISESTAVESVPLYTPSIWDVFVPIVSQFVSVAGVVRGSMSIFHGSPAVIAVGAVHSTPPSAPTVRTSPSAPSSGYAALASNGTPSASTPPYVTT